MYNFRCHCGRCSAMHTTEQSRCCHEVERVWAKVEDYNTRNIPLQCITDHPGFQSACLNQYTLEIAYYAYCQDHGAMREPSHEKCRYTAYRQLTRWCWRYLGKKVRVPLPACAVTRIREVYPSDGDYVGFRWAE